MIVTPGPAALDPVPPAVREGIATAYPYRYAVVDVETSGLDPAVHRVLQVAVTQLDAATEVEGQFSTLLDPGCDPGPVGVHGLTREALAGAPTFEQVAARLHGLLAGRVLVAHNAAFDWRFLLAESQRCGLALPVEHRLCTGRLTRRLDLPVTDLKLSSLATYWGVPQHHAHDAVDDTRVLVEVFRHGLAASAELGLRLPFASCLPPGLTPCTATSSTTTSSAGTSPTTTSPGRRRSPSPVPARRAAPHLLDAPTGPAAPAVPPVPPDPAVPPLPPAPASTTGSGSVAGPVGPLGRRRVLVLGGPHAEAARLRAWVGELGGLAGVNLTARTTHVIALPGAERDPRCARAAARGVVVLGPHDLHLLATSQPAAPGGATPSGTGEVGRGETGTGEVGGEVVVLPRGAAVDLPDGLSDLRVELSWSQSDTPGEGDPQIGDPQIGDPQDAGVQVDVIALCLDAAERVRDDADLVFFNAPVHPGGAVELDVDTEGEAVATIRTQGVPDDVRTVKVVATLPEGVTFGDLGAVQVSVRDGQGAPWVQATLDAATSERSLMLVDVYRRGDVWRLRVQGQGYDHGLRRFVEQHGVRVEA